MMLLRRLLEATRGRSVFLQMPRPRPLIRFPHVRGNGKRAISGSFRLVCGLFTRA